MKQAVLAVAVLAAAGVTLGADGDDAKKDLDALQGTWEYAKHVTGGKEAPKDKVEGMTLKVKGDKWEVEKDGTVLLAGTVKLDPAKKPKAADWAVTSDGPYKDQTILSIYKIGKDSFDHCWGETRPEKFESPDDTKVVLTSFVRAKKK